MKTKGQRRTVGSILAVPLGDGTFCFAITLPEADFGFFDARLTEPVLSPDLLSKPILFRVAVHKSAYNKGRWLKVGTLEVPSELLKAVPTFIQDKLNPEQFEIYLGGDIHPATREQCEGLERAAVWDPEHIEDRLRDYYAGVPNVWVESLRLK